MATPIEQMQRIFADWAYPFLSVLISSYQFNPKNPELDEGYNGNTDLTDVTDIR